MKRRAEQNSPQMATAEAVNRAQRPEKKAVPSPSRMTARSTMANTARGFSGDRGTASAVALSPPPPVFWVRSRKRLALSAAPPPPSVTDLEVSRSWGAVALAVSGVAGSTGVRSRPMTRSIPRMAVGPLSPMRITKKDRKKQPTAAANAIAAAQEGRPRPVAPAEARMMAGRAVGLKGSPYRSSHKECSVRSRRAGPFVTIASCLHGPGRSCSPAHGWASVRRARRAIVPIQRRALGIPVRPRCVTATRAGPLCW